jgi:tetratricopeptide (TPR) repeat protein
MKQRSDSFGRLLKAGIGSIAAIEGTTAPVVEADLGQQIGLSGFQIQRYKAGHLPPDPRTVEILARAGVTRGLMGRAWLDRSLQAARFPAAERLIAELFPAAPARARPTRVLHNLPPPTYAQFVMRPEAYDAVVAGLRQRAALVLIAGLSGVGKTSLAREVAAGCLRGEGGAPRYDAVVWISDKDHPGTTNLSTTLDTIARTLDYPGLIQFAYDEKRDAVEQLLRGQHVLLIIDNVETIADGALLEWLLRLPEPSKAIVTSREDRQAFRNNTFAVTLDPMHEAEAQALIDQRLRALQLTQLAKDRQALVPLIAATGGNPKAIEVSLGLLKYEHRPLPQVLEQIAAARGALFDDLFARAWVVLDAVTQRVLLALTLFPASASGTALSATAAIVGDAFEWAIQHLSDLSLLDVQRTDLISPPRFAMHPLVRAFAAARLDEQRAFAEAARERWLQWYVQLAARVGFCWDNLDRLALLDPEHETLHTVLGWAFAQGRYRETIDLIEGVRYYYNVRGLWDERLNINQLRAKAAREIGDTANEVVALAHHVEVRSKQGNLAEAAEYLEKLLVAAQAAALPDDYVFETQHARALYSWALGDMAEAQRIWQQLLGLSSRLGGQKHVINRRWLATCLYQQGQRDTARQLYQESLEDARRINDARSVSGNALKLAAIDLERGDLDAAAAALAECRAIAERYHDRRRLAELQRLTGQLHIARGETDVGGHALTVAADLFERMGMQRELLEVRKEIERLKEVEQKA